MFRNLAIFPEVQLCRASQIQDGDDAAMTSHEAQIDQLVKEDPFLKESVEELLTIPRIRMLKRTDLLGSVDAVEAAFQRATRATSNLQHVARQADSSIFFGGIQWIQFHMFQRGPRGLAITINEILFVAQFAQSSFRCCGATVVV